ncbi:alpha-amylase family glycosyl hydrolase [Palleronia sp. LCG004]|uniref:alpha-amylase family glycosyl hydrolase n=1 Tax=Palleronia sp. LCG004 TaxID=3079304 RepID=UPI002943ACA1|nr:alpha-amylase family glycosyl hydrolase [Palleronia sp. LCG004]WOI55544.1 alpha-amylase family glycosyl hydrolase [Palleronia sp. LCG004]
MPERLRHPTIYEIYPRSFRDSTGTGEGDLRGVIEKLGHVRDLGADAVWLAPFFVSPLADAGYDIVDHCAVDPRFGTMEDVDALIARAHELDLKVIFDLVFNHTSCEHPDFLASIEGDEDAAARYVWRDAKPDGSPPNNWLSFFGEGAWSWNHKRRQYYFHQFLTCQPSLDLRHEAVRVGHRKTVEFWVARGVDGFRMDAITSYLFDESLKDNPPAAPEVRAKVTGEPFNPYTFQDHVYDMLPGDGAAFGETVRDWAGPDIWIMGENNSGNRAIEMSLDFTREGRLDAAYALRLASIADGPQGYADTIAALDGRWIAPWWFSNHDGARHVSTLGDESAASAKFFALLLSVLPGTILIYQGEELGLPQPDLVKDVVSDPHDLLYWPDGPGRSGARVPIPWFEDEPHRGFSTAEPWLPMDWGRGLSVAAQEGDPQSVLSFYRVVLRLRRELGLAHAVRVDPEAAGDALTLRIELGEARYVAIFNFGEAPIAAGEGEILAETGRVDDRLPRWGGILRRG